MMWTVYFFMFFFLSTKDFTFCNSFMSTDDSSCFMTSISPLILIIILSTLFNFFGYEEYLKYSFMFMANILVVSLCFLSDSSMFYLIFLESTVYLMAFMILNFSKDSDKLFSMFLMFAMNMMGSILFMVFSSKILKIYSLDSYTLNFLVNNQISSIFIWLTFATIFLTKLPMMFFHFWLTKAHVSASGSCSMLLASLMLKLGSFGLLKFSIIFIISSSFIMNIGLAISIYSCLIFGLMMVRFLDLKYMIACSSVIHMSLLFPLSMYFGSMPMVGSIFMMVAHGLVSYYLFFLVSLMYEFAYNRSMDFNKSVESISKNLMIFLALFMFLNLGIPPFINFLGELMLCSSLESISFISLTTFMVSMVVSIMFSMFMVTKTIFGKKNLIVSADSNYSLNMTTSTFLILTSILPVLYN